MMAEAEQTNLTTLTVELLSAYVSKNSIPDGNLAALIQSTHAALKSIDDPAPIVPAEPEYVPAVPVRKSRASRKHLLSLIDGKPYVTLKRHLKGHGLTPAEYRERYGLPKDYPMVAPEYAEKRRAIAQRLGLGQRVKGNQMIAAAEPEPVKAEEAPPVAPKPARIPKTKAVVSEAAPAAAVSPKTPAAKQAAAKKTAAKQATAPAAAEIKAGSVDAPAPAIEAPIPPVKTRGRKPAAAKPAATAKTKAAKVSEPVAAKAPARKRGRPAASAEPASPAPAENAG
jgi:predicted transcriptional regulator